MCRRHMQGQDRTGLKSQCWIGPSMWKVTQHRLFTAVPRHRPEEPVLDRSFNVHRLFTAVLSQLI